MECICIYMCVCVFIVRGTSHAAKLIVTDDKKVICYIFVVVFLIYLYKLFISQIPISLYNEF